AAPELEVVERRRPAERMGVTVVGLEADGLATSLASIVPKVARGVLWPDQVTRFPLSCRRSAPRHARSSMS
ncbi:MAG TPA: hypothetical protein VHU80_03060, partial [Polyangiaceae bacterium]|nr:hypothetical protein [Polyangiaceae bacterium]